MEGNTFVFPFYVLIYSIDKILFIYLPNTRNLSNFALKFK